VFIWYGWQWLPHYIHCVTGIIIIKATTNTNGG
jgi:hypothetical protein